LETTVFREGIDIAGLPWFSLIDGHRIVLADKSVGRAIDVHTHLALAYVLPMRVDLHAAAAPTEHYLSMRGRRIDFEVYLNKNFTPDDLKRMKRDLTLKSLTAGGMRRTHTIPNLCREMADLGIARSVSLPIDYPVLSTNGVDTLRALKDNDNFIVFGSVHPYASQVERKLDQQLALGARGVKVHPAVQAIRPDSRRALKLYRLCGERGLPVMFHCGPVGIEPRLGRYLSQVVFYEKALAETPDVRFILGHSGALQMELALEYAKRYPHVYLDLSCQSLSNVRTILREADPDRLLYGTDWPFYHQAIAMAKILMATEGNPGLRRKVLYENAARLFGL
jgi:uncharacterized protein